MQADSKTFLFVGLGNPGHAYEGTRHNIGARVIQELASRIGWSLKEDRRFKAKVARGVCDHHTLHLVLPLTFMNLSGEAVKPYADYFKISLDHLVIVIDDISLAFGQLRLRGMGSSGGHNGLKSIQHFFGTSHYKRLRMGVGHPGETMLANYVLENFNEMEQKELPFFTDRGVKVLERLLKESFTHVMNSVNTIPRQPSVDAKTTDLTKPPIAG